MDKHVRASAVEYLTGVPALTFEGHEEKHPHLTKYFAALADHDIVRFGPYATLGMKITSIILAQEICETGFSRWNDAKSKALLTGPGDDGKVRAHQGELQGVDEGPGTPALAGEEVREPYRISLRSVDFVIVVLDGCAKAHCK